ncbi:hypothetical protein PYCC9005_000331 [Savitreella phatthalungensis]
MSASTQSAEQLLNRIAAGTRHYRPSQNLLLQALRQSYAVPATQGADATGSPIQQDTVEAMNPFAATKSSESTKGSALSRSAGKRTGLTLEKVNQALRQYRNADASLKPAYVAALARLYCFDVARPQDFGVLAADRRTGLCVGEEVGREWARGVVARYLRGGAAEADAEASDSEPQTVISTNDSADAADELNAAGDKRQDRKPARRVDPASPLAILDMLRTLSLLHTGLHEDVAVLGTALYGLAYGSRTAESDESRLAVADALVEAFEQQKATLNRGSGTSLTRAQAERRRLDYAPLLELLRDTTIELPSISGVLRKDMTTMIENAIARWAAIAESSPAEASASTSFGTFPDAVLPPPSSWQDYLARAGSLTAHQ